MYVPLSPARLADTRSNGSTVDGLGPSGAVGPQGSATVQVTGRGGVPAVGVGAVAVNVTAVGPTANTFVTVFPSGQPRPNASNLNPIAGRTAPNMVIATVGAGGAIELYNRNGQVHLLVDVLGWFPAASDYGALSPARLADTRIGQATVDGSGPKGAAGPQATVTVPVAGRGGVPSGGVAAVAVNVTAVTPTSNTFVTVHPSGQPLPTASNLNPVSGQTVPNMVIAKLGIDGSIALYNRNGATHLLVDVLGWFPDGSDYSALTPARLADTRPANPTVDGLGPKGALGPQTTIRVKVTGRGGIPNSGVGAVAINVTAVAPTAGTFITVFPAGESRPTASNLNPAAGQTVPNMVIAKVGVDGSIDLYNRNGTVNLIVDVLGWLPDARILQASEIGAGEGHTCALVGGGAVECWGDNGAGQLGDQSNQRRTSPVTVTGLAGATALAVGGNHTCALVAGGEVRCWGNNGVGQLGDGSTLARNTPTPVPGIVGATAIAAGREHTCVAVAGGVQCWGANDWGQLGNGGSINSGVPVTVTGLTGVTELAAGYHHTCASIAGSQVKCWGENYSGQLGDGTSTDRTIPVTTLGVTGVTGLAAGDYHTCAVLNAGSVRCWGDNSAGQLGAGGTIASATTAVPTVGIADAVGITAGRGHSCALAADGSARCWGYNFDGQVGDGTTTERSTPVVVGGLAGALVIDAGVAHTCAVVGSGQVMCWGANGSGQLGNGGTIPSLTPVATRGF
ncbi:MAG: hypothetical protein H6525_00940 [Actinobacteria bacterium]|nr:hypothetical protein [Actinomycetota bacterium]MCB9411412.1 hypothetical protein [Actinomycetota bacterium]